MSWAFYARRDPATHKRLILLATFIIIGPAIARLRIGHDRIWFFLLLNLFPALLLIYDLWTRRSLHRSTICGVALMVAMEVVHPVVAQSALMNHAIVWIQR